MMLAVQSVAWHVRAYLMENPAPGAANGNRCGWQGNVPNALHPVLTVGGSWEGVEEWCVAELCHGARTLVHTADIIITLSPFIWVFP